MQFVLTHGTSAAGLLRAGPHGAPAEWTHAARTDNRAHMARAAHMRSNAPACTSRTSDAHSLQSHLVINGVEEHYSTVWVSRGREYMQTTSVEAADAIVRLHGDVRAVVALVRSGAHDRAADAGLGRRASNVCAIGKRWNVRYVTSDDFTLHPSRAV